jgi:hypothetical protein
MDSKYIGKIGVKWVIKLLKEDEFHFLIYCPVSVFLNCNVNIEAEYKFINVVLTKWSRVNLTHRNHRKTHKSYGYWISTEVQVTRRMLKICFLDLCFQIFQNHRYQYIKKKKIELIYFAFCLINIFNLILFSEKKIWMNVNKWVQNLYKIT